NLLSAGKLAEAQEQIEQAIDVADAAGGRNAYTLPFSPWLATGLREPRSPFWNLKLQRRNGMVSTAQRAGRRAVRAAWICKNDLPHAYRELGLILAMRGSIRPALNYLQRSLDWAKTQQARYEFAQTLLAKAELEAEFECAEAFADRAEAQAI